MTDGAMREENEWEENELDSYFPNPRIPLQRWVIKTATHATFDNVFWSAE